MYQKHVRQSVLSRNENNNSDQNRPRNANNFGIFKYLNCWPD